MRWRSSSPSIRAMTTGGCGEFRRCSTAPTGRRAEGAASRREPRAVTLPSGYALGLNGGGVVSTTSRPQTPLDQVRVGDRENFHDGPPLELFRRMRSQCPVHWTPGITEYPGGGGLLVGHDRRRRLHGQPRLGDLLLRTRRLRRPANASFPLELQHGDVHRDGPAEARPRQGALPARLHAAADRRARGRDPRDHDRVLDRLEGRERRSTSSTTSPSRSSRVIGSFMGLDAVRRRSRGRSS